MSNLITLIVIILYFAFVIYTRAMVSRKARQNAEGFFLGSRNMGPIVTAMSAEASDMSAFLFMGLPGLAYISGFSYIIWIILGLTIGLYLSFLLIAKRLRIYSKTLEAVTIPDFFSKRFAEKDDAIKNITTIIIVIFLVPYMAAAFSAIGKLLNTLFGFNYNIGVVIGSIIIIIYTTVTGFGSMAVMDLIQTNIITFALAVLVFFSIRKAGGWYQVKLNYETPINGLNSNSIFSIISMLAWGIGYLGMPHILVHFMAIRHEEELRISRRVATIWAFIVMSIAGLTGVVAYTVSNVGYVPILDDVDAEKLVFYITNLIKEQGLFFCIVAGLVLSGVIASVLTTADSQLLCAASSVSESLAKSILNKKIDNRKGLVIVRIIIVVMIIFALFFSLDPSNKIFSMVSFAWAGFGACIGSVMLLALFSKKVNAVGVKWGLIVSVIVVFIWKFIIRSINAFSNIYELLPAFIIGILVSILMSKKSKVQNRKVTDIFDEVMAQVKE